MATAFVSADSDVFRFSSGMPRTYAGPMEPTEGLGVLGLELKNTIAQLLQERLAGFDSLKESSPLEDILPPPGLEAFAVSATMRTATMRLTKEVVPSKVHSLSQMLLSFPAPDAQSGWTTAMVKNIPPKLQQFQLMQVLDKLGFSNSVDFLYIPPDCGRYSARLLPRNRGIAYINFTTPAEAADFSEVAHGRLLPHSTWKKAVEVSAAPIQGFDANAQKHMAKLMDPTARNKPLLFREACPPSLDVIEGARQAGLQPAPESHHVLDSDVDACTGSVCSGCGAAGSPSCASFCFRCGARLPAN